MTSVALAEDVAKVDCILFLSLVIISKLKILNLLLITLYINGYKNKLINLYLQVKYSKFTKISLECLEFGVLKAEKMKPDIFRTTLGTLGTHLLI